MDWLNIHTSTLDSPDFVRCDPIRRATWLMLLRFCAGQENGGEIIGCKNWGDTTWQQMARVRLKEVRLESPLWSWDGDCLIVKFYPIEKQDELQAKRTGGAYGGKAATQAKAEAARLNGAKGGRPITQAEPKLITQAEPKLNPTEGKGTEGKEGEGECVQQPTPTPLVVSDQETIHGKDPGKLACLAKPLRRWGMVATPDALVEWADAMQGRGGCKSIFEVLSGIEWIGSKAAKAGIAVKYMREAGELIGEWRRVVEFRRERAGGEVRAFP